MWGILDFEGDFIFKVGNRGILDFEYDFECSEVGKNTLK